MLFLLMFCLLFICVLYNFYRLILSVINFEFYFQYWYKDELKEDIATRVEAIDARETEEPTNV